MATDRDSNSEKVCSKTLRTNEELAIINEQIEAPEVKVSYGSLFRYATTWDIILIMIGSICAIAAGFALPLMTVRYTTSSPLFRLQLTISQLASHRFIDRLLQRSSRRHH